MNCQRYGAGVYAWREQTINLLCANNTYFKCPRNPLCTIEWPRARSARSRNDRRSRSSRARAPSAIRVILQINWQNVYSNRAQSRRSPTADAVDGAFRDNGNCIATYAIGMKGISGSKPIQRARARARVCICRTRNLFKMRESAHESAEERSKTTAPTIRPRSRARDAEKSEMGFFRGYARAQRAYCTRNGRTDG